MKKVVVVFLGFLVPSLWAHTGVHGDFTFAQGFWHPLSGADHILAMFAVGVFASLFTQKDILKVLAAFIGMMGISALVGTYRLDIPFIEAGIVASIVLFGLMIVFAATIPYRAALGMIAVFAMFHGYAHGYEFTGQGSFAGYLAGFSLATLAIHLSGLAAGQLLQKITLGSGRGIKLAGGVIALGGLSLI